METATDQNRRIEAAARLNFALARRVDRWKRVRLGIASLLFAAGVVTSFLGTNAIFAAPFFVGAFISILLYLDARDQAKEVRKRNWNSPTPQIGRLSAARRQEAKRGQNES